MNQINPRLAIRRLWWKELRQLAPLAVMLLGMAAFAHLISSLGDKSPHAILLPGAPLLFAIGAGALLIGQEKEQETLTWLTTLPIAARDLVRVKLWACIFALGAMWAASYVLFSLFVLIDGRVSEFDLVLTTREWVNLILQTLFMLLVGIFLAWQFRSSLLALGLMVPIAVLPSMFASRIEDAAGGWMLGFLVAGIAMSAVLGRAAGLRALAPEVISGAVSSLPARASAKPVVRNWDTPQTRGTALLWQYGGQTLALLVGGGLLALIPAAGLLWGDVGPQVTVVIMLLVGVGVSWLGAASFVGDRIQDRIRFLADRGISPTIVWLSRHAIPLCILTIGGIVLGLGLSVVTDGFFAGHSIACCYCILVFWSVYVPSQWIGQLIRSPVVAAISAPAFGLLAIGMGWFAVSTLGSPVWLVVALTTLPMLTTWWVMPKWMDGRLDWRYWSIHVATFVVICVAAFMPTILAQFEPGAPRGVKVEVQDYLKTNVPKTNVQTWGPGVLAYAVEDELDAGGSSSEFARIDLYRQQLRDGSIDSIAVRWLIAEAMRCRWAFEQTGGQANAEMELYPHVMRCLTEAGRSLLGSASLVDQDQFAAVEHGLRIELQSSAAEKWLPDSIVSAARALIDDDAAKWDGRRRAVAAAWQDWLGDSSPRRHREENSYGFTPAGTLQMNVAGYWLGDQLPVRTMRDQAIARRQIERGLGLLWELATSRGKTVNDSMLLELAEAFGAPASAYGVGLADEDVWLRWLGQTSVTPFAAPGQGWICGLADPAAVPLEDHEVNSDD